MLRFRLRTLMIVLPLGPPVFAGLVLLSPVNRMALIDLLTLLALVAAKLWLWDSWPTLT
jgi:hypothetical protein